MAPAPGPAAAAGHARAGRLLADRHQGRDRATTSPATRCYYVKRQAIYAVVGLVLMYGVSRLDYSRLRELRYPIYGAADGLDHRRARRWRRPRAARSRWIPLPGFNLQPSELGKVLLVVALAGLRRRAHARDGAPDDGPGDVARAAADDDRHGRAGSRLGHGLRRRDARDPVRRGRAVAPFRRADRAVRGQRHVRAGGGAEAGRRGAPALPGGPPDGVPASLGRHRRRRLPAGAGADRDRLRREDRPRRRERHPDVARTSCPSTTPTSSTR